MGAGSEESGIRRPDTRGLQYEDDLNSGSGTEWRNNKVIYYRSHD